MTIYLALLRAVNVGGRNAVSMADLRELLGSLGFADARTLLQSGNLVFRAAARSAARLEGVLADETARRLGVETEYFVRSAAEWAAVIRHNPLPREAARDPGHFLVMPLKDAPRPAAVRALQDAITGRETVRAVGRQLYLVYPDGVGRSRLTSSVIERALGTRGTGRNWNTARKLAALAGV
jgi:uncharacterized protein (DUF1697 family)